MMPDSTTAASTAPAEQPAAEAAPAPVRRPWHRPTLTQIELNATAAGGVSGTGDFVGS